MTKERKAVVLASLTAVLLIIIKLTFALITWSMAILTSAIDSSLDFVVSLMNFFAIKKSEEPHDEDHNYGHWKVEWFWALFEWMIISVSWLIVIYASIQKILEKNFMKWAWESLLVMIICMIITWGLVRHLKKVADETWSLVVKADSLHYKSDLYTNWWIIIALWLIYVLKMPILDPLIWIVIAIYIIIWSIEIMKEWFDMLMDKRIDSEDIEIIYKMYGRNILRHPYRFSRHPI